jgi:hypothetical protein
MSIIILKMSVYEHMRQIKEKVCISTLTFKLAYEPDILKSSIDVLLLVDAIKGRVKLNLESPGRLVGREEARSC